MPRTHGRSNQPGLLWAAFFAALATVDTVHAQMPGLTCDLSGYVRRPDATAALSGDVLALEWAGAEGERVSLRLAVRSGTPTVDELALLPRGSSEWVTIGRELGFEFRIVEGFRRISNQQLVPLRELEVDLTQDVVDRYKWDVFWDAPLDLSEPAGRGGNPPPAAGVANQPGLPRSEDEIRR